MKFNFLKEFELKNLYCNVGVAIVGAAVVGGAATAYSANKAASAQEDAANQANARLTAQNQQTRDDLAPFRNIGTTAATQLTSQLPALTAPIKMDETTLRNTPGYQFNLTQGLKATQNAAAARGLGVSGAALKGASAFATGLADNTYQNQFNNANINQTNAYNRLKGLVDVGENAGAQTGVIGANLNTTAASNTIGAGNAQAAAYNTTGGAINSAVNNIGGYAAYKGLYDSGSSYTAPQDIVSGGSSYGAIY